MKKAFLILCLSLFLSPVVAQATGQGSEPQEPPLKVTAELVQETKQLASETGAFYGKIVSQKPEITEKFKTNVIYAEVVPYDSYIYDAITTIARQAYSTTVSSTRRPCTKGELLTDLNAIDTTKLDKKTLELYDKVYLDLIKDTRLVKSGGFGFDINAIVALQGQYNSDGPELNTDKYIRYNETPALFSIPFSLTFSDFVYIYCDVDLRKNWWSYFLSAPYCNIPISAALDIDSNVPTKLAFSIGNSMFNITSGRSRINIGNALLGSMIFSDLADGIYYISLSGFHKDVRASLTIYPFSKYRFLYTHEIVFRIAKVVSVRIYEGEIGLGNFDFRFLNPLMVFHNIWAGMDKYDKFTFTDVGKTGYANSMQFAVEIDATVYKGLRLYGQLSFNQIQTASELNLYSGAAAKIPNGIGGLFGIEYQHPFKAGFLTFGSEFLYSSPWHFIGSNDLLSLQVYKREIAAPMGLQNEEALVSMWFANPIGPDTMAGILKLKFEDPNKYGVDFSYRFVAKGDNEEKYLNRNKKEHFYYPTTVEEALIKTPSGEATYFHTLKLQGFDYIIPKLKLDATLSWTISHGKYSGHNFYISTSLSYSIR